MKIIEAVVGEGGVLHIENLPLAAGSRVEVIPIKAPASMTQAEWAARVRSFAGSLAHVDFDTEDQYPEPVEPLFLSEDETGA